MSNIIQSLWIGDSLSVMERTSLASFIRHGHEVHLYTYGEMKGVPAGVVLKDAAEIIPASLLDYRVYPKLALFADLFRYKLLHDRGGWWVDTDMICVRPFDFENDTIIASEAAKTGGLHPTNSILKAPVGSSLMKWLWDVGLKMNPSLIQWSDTGPKLIKRAVEELGLQKLVQPPVTFCPIPWWEASSLVDANKVPLVPPEAHAVHLWNEQWKYINCSKTVINPGSLYAQLITKYDTQPDMSSVTAVVKTFLRDQSLFNCVQTLKMSYPSIHIIVADDGNCSLEKEKQLKAMGVDRYIQIPERGLSAGRNRLIEVCETPHTLLCDDDFSFTPECHLERLLELTEVVDIAGGLVYNLRNWTGCDTGVGWDITGGNFITKGSKLWVDGTRGKVLEYNGIRYERMEFVLNYFIAKTETIRRVMWDESLRFSTEHVDFCLRAKNLGITSGRCLDSYVLHKAIDDVQDPNYLKNRTDVPLYRELFAKKWGFAHPEHLIETLPTIDEPIPATPLIEKKKPVVLSPVAVTPVSPVPPAVNWQEGFLDKKVHTLFQKFRYVVATVPKSAHYKQLCRIYPKHLEEIVDTPEGPRIIFVVEKAVEN